MTKPNVTGGIAVRSNTSMEPTRTIVVPVEVHVVESTINAGFQMNWIDGEDDKGTVVQLSVGAGLGSRYGTLRVGDLSAVFDAAQFLQDAAESLLKDD